MSWTSSVSMVKSQVSTTFQPVLRRPSRSLLVEEQAMFEPRAPLAYGMESRCLAMRLEQARELCAGAASVPTIKSRTSACARVWMVGGYMPRSTWDSHVRKEVLAEVTAVHAKVPVERQMDGQNRSRACRQ